jgi:hypothetical protein
VRAILRPPSQEIDGEACVGSFRPRPWLQEVLALFTRDATVHEAGLPQTCRQPLCNRSVPGGAFVVVALQRAWLHAGWHVGAATNSLDIR